MAKKSQIATILTLIMAVIFLFIVITINIGNVAQEKTMISNAADGAALLLSSMLGSLANALVMKIGGLDECNIDFSIILALIAVIISLGVAIGTLGFATPALVAAMAWLGVAVSAVFFGMGMWNALVTEPGIFKQLELKFQNMTLEQRMKEKAIQYALFSVVSDPNKICADGQCGDPKEHGGCVDPSDLDMDGQTTGDCIHCFSNWYNERLKALPRVGEIVEEFYKTMFSYKIGGKVPRIYVLEDPDTWLAVKDEYGFWIDTDKDGWVDLDATGSLSMEIASNDPHDPRGVVYAHDIYVVRWDSQKKTATGWLEEGFKPLVRELDQYGYGLSWYLKDALTEISNLEFEVKDFQIELSKLYGATFDNRVESFDEWILLFYNDDPKKEDWYKRMQSWLDRVNSWIYTLSLRTRQINEDFQNCWSPGPWECGYNDAGGACCRSHNENCNGHDCNPHPCEPCDAFGTCNTCYDTCYDTCCICDSRCGCNSSGRGYAQLCPSNHCTPSGLKSTPTGGWRKCCDSVAYLHNQLCDAGQYCTGGGGCKDEACCDTYYNCGVDDALNHITREHAIEYLTQFANDVRILRDAFKQAYDKGKTNKNDPRFYEVFYEWDDKVAKGGPAEQKIHHMAYVKLSDNLKPANGFKVPYLYNYRSWFPLPMNCVKVENAQGTFDITVARYDGDVGQTPGSPLRNFWIFKTRKNPAAGEQIRSGYTDPTVNPSTYQEKANFVLQNGIVSRTEGHYGPGKTYTKEQIKSWSTRAKERNRDIYIKRLQ